MMYDKQSVLNTEIADRFIDSLYAIKGAEYLTFSFVKKVYDCHLHDHYKVEIPDKAINDLMDRAIYKKGYLKIGGIEYKLI